MLLPFNIIILQEIGVMHCEKLSEDVTLTMAWISIHTYSQIWRIQMNVFLFLEIFKLLLLVHKESKKREQEVPILILRNLHLWLRESQRDKEFKAHLIEFKHLVAGLL